MLKKWLISLSFLCMAQAHASPLVFQGQNAALFPGANPAGTATLMNSVDKPVAALPQTPVADPARLIQQSLQSQISNKIYQDIFQSDAASGFYDLGGGSSIGFERTGGNVIINITNPTNGSTVITIPDI